jgi:hypothetical protein
VTPRLAVRIALGLVAGAAAAEPAPRVQIAICDSHHHVLRCAPAAPGDDLALGARRIHTDVGMACDRVAAPGALHAALGDTTVT